MDSVVSLNTKVTPEEKEAFVQIAERLGMNASTAVKVLIRRFIDVGGFPFDVRIPSAPFDWDSPNLIHVKHDQFGNAIMPVTWRDDDDED